MNTTPVRSYIIVFAVLLGLTIATIAVAYIDLGPLSTPIALLIAGVKATLVMIFFMHLGQAEHSVGISLGSGFFLLTVLLVFSLADLFTRAG